MEPSMTFMAAGVFRSSRRSRIRTAAESTINMPLPTTLRWLSLSPSSMSGTPTQPEVYVQGGELDVLLCNVLRTDRHLRHGDDCTGTTFAVTHDLLNRFFTVQSSPCCKWRSVRSTLHSSTS